MAWLSDHGVKIVVLLIAALVFKKFIKIVLEKFIRRIIVSDRFHSKESEEKRENTLIQISTSAINVLIYVVLLLLLMQEVGFEIGPILAAAGVAGLAFSFGGQYLIKDLITGLFMIIENQYRIGDVVCFGEVCGAVEAVTMRMTTLRDLDGVVHHVPHGSITKVSNLSKEYARVNLNVGVSYGSDLEKVIKVVNQVGVDLYNDPVWKNVIIKAPQFLRVDDFADSAIIVKILGDTRPLKQWDVTGELRKRIKVAFDKEGIEIPFPQMVIHNKK